MKEDCIDDFDFLLLGRKILFAITRFRCKKGNTYSAVRFESEVFVQNRSDSPVMYFKGRNFRRKKISRILAKFAKLDSFFGPRKC